MGLLTASILALGTIALVRRLGRARKRSGSARRNEAERHRACTRVIRDFLGAQGYLACEVASREELLALVEGGISPAELSAWIENRRATVRGPLLGHRLEANERVPVVLPEGLRTRHTYIVGKSGSGKTTLIRNLVLHDLAAGHGLAVMGAEAELIEQEILPAIPESRWNDVVYVNPLDTTAPVPLNPLHVDTGEDLDLKVQETLSILQRLFEDDVSGAAPRMETILRQSLYTLMQLPGSTLLDLEPLLDRTDETFRRYALDRLPDEEARRFWTNVYPAYPKDAHLAIVNRIGRLLRPKFVRNLLCAPGGSLSVRRCMDQGKILLLHLPDGRLGEQNAQVLGQLAVAKVQLGAMSRADVPKEARRPFILYLDEFQSFCNSAATSYGAALSRGRKYGLGLVLAHQQTGQISEPVMREILGNVSTAIAFNVGATDARRLSREFVADIDGSPVPLEPEEFLRLRVGEAICRIGRNVVRIATPPPPPGGSDAVRDEVIRRSRERFGSSAPKARRQQNGREDSPGLGGLNPSEVF